MYVATLCFLAVAGGIVLVAFCRPTARRAEAAGAPTIHTSLPVWDEKASWGEIKAVWVDWYSRCQANEAPREKSLRSWGLTLCACAVLCMVGVFLEVQYNQNISVSSLLNGFGSQVSASAYRSRQRSTTSPAPGKTVRSMKRTA